MSHPERPEYDQPTYQPGYRMSRRSSKGGKRLRREARAQRTRDAVQERAGDAAETLGRGARGATRVAGLVFAAIAVVVLVATGVNYVARTLAKQDGGEPPSSGTTEDASRENVLIIGVDDAGADFLAVRVDHEDEQAFGIAIPDGAFMEVPGQGFERVGDSYRAGPEVSLAAISNYLSVPFARYIVVPRERYRQALTEQSLAGIVDAARESNLEPDEAASLAAELDGLASDKVALVSLPVRPITLGDETYFEPQRDQVAELLLTWWGVRPEDDDGVVRVIVYNGSGIPGIAGEAATVLIKAGMRVVDTRNADRFDYPETLIVMQDGDTQAAAEVESALSVGKVVDQPTQQNVADIIVIIGTDWQPPKE